MDLKKLVIEKIYLLNGPQKGFKDSILNIDANSILLSESPNIHLYEDGIIVGTNGYESFEATIPPKSNGWKLIEKAKKSHGLGNPEELEKFWNK